MRLKDIPLFVLAFLVTFFLFSSCKEDTLGSKVDIKGRWEVYNALRNNQPTSTLQNAYFEFVNDSVMKTNILGSEIESAYEFGPQKKSIRQYGNPLIEYQIREISEDSMKLSAKIREYSFQFFLARN